MSKRSGTANGQAQGAQAISTAAAGADEFQRIPTDQVLDPEPPARTQFDEAALGELIDSVNAIGIRIPLIVRPEGALFRCEDGHRRLVAARAVRLPWVPCIVWSGEQADAIEFRLAANVLREGMNPADEALYLEKLLEEKCGGDVDKLVARVRLRREYVEGRLLLRAGDLRVFEAVAGGAVSLGVAAELNKVKDPALRLSYLDAAAAGGASVRMVRDWRTQANTFAGSGEIAASVDAGLGVAAPVTERPRTECFLCHSDEDQHDFTFLPAHKSCIRVMQRSQPEGATFPPEARRA